MSKLSEERFNEVIMRCAIAVVVATISIALVLTALQFGWVEKTASSGDVLTLASIIVAAGIAGYGWWRADRNTRKERERIAKADAVILYRKLADAGVVATALLVYFTASPFGNLLVSFPTSPGKIKAGATKINLLELYAWIRLGAQAMIGKIPDIHAWYGDLRSMYADNVTLGDTFMNIFVSIEELKMVLGKFADTSPEKSVESFVLHPDRQEREFHLLMALAVGICLNREESRKLLDGVDFDPRITLTDMAAVKRCLYEFIGKNHAHDDGEVTAEEYLKMLKLGDTAFGEILKESEFSIHGN